MPTIKDVAREAGVSIATVSYVLNNKSASVSEETRRQVLETIERIGYTPNVTARNLKASQTRLIGYAWHEVPSDQVNSVLDRFTYYLAQAAEAHNYHILTFTHPLHQPIPVYDELIRTQRVDAFVLAGTTAEDERIRFLIEADFPFVSFGRSRPDWLFPWVDTDGQSGVRDAVSYLVSLGHRRIGMVAWPEDSISGNFRLAGYLEGLARAGIEARPEYILRGEHSELSGRRALAQWLELPPDQQPTAIVAVTDLVAVGVMNEARARGIAIGKDLSLIGYDDAPMTQYLSPGLTTVQQPIIEIGQALIRMLETVISRSKPTPDPVLIPSRLVIRESCAPPAR
jgi:DNA-binding LacI/PurR family transcriptional regulator